MTAEQRCVHDMLPGQCALCTSVQAVREFGDELARTVGPPLRQAGEAFQAFSAAAAEAAERVAGSAFAAPVRAGRQVDGYGPTIAASYRGRCEGCGDRIEPGDSIRHSDAHGGFVHEGCEE